MAKIQYGILHRITGSMNTGNQHGSWFNPVTEYIIVKKGGNPTKWAKNDFKRRRIKFSRSECLGPCRIF